jgi:hypothetical protein
VPGLGHQRGGQLTGCLDVMVLALPLLGLDACSWQSESAQAIAVLACLVGFNCPSQWHLLIVKLLGKLPPGPPVSVQTMVRLRPQEE